MGRRSPGFGVRVEPNGERPVVWVDGDDGSEVTVEHVEPVLFPATQDAVTGLKDRYRRFSLQRSVFRHWAKVLIGQGNSPASP